MIRIAFLLSMLAIVASACSATLQANSPTPAPTRTAEVAVELIPPVESLIVRNQLGFAFPPAPEVPDGPPDARLVAAIDELFAAIGQRVEIDALRRIADSGDARAAWLISDLLRVLGRGQARDVALSAFEQLTGADLSADPVAGRSEWQSVTDHLFAWELPALPGYAAWKRQLFTLIEPRWEPFFADVDSAIDWRFVSWGGVLMDARAFGDPRPCAAGCIPALDDPAVTDAAGGDWYPDELLVFGITVNGESRAYPRHMMEIHEMVNDELGGRRLGIPYCTLCGAAQAYLTDETPDGIEMPVLRTSGLLSRSNKVMFDLNTFSVFDTFLGDAISGPLHKAGLQLAQTSVVTSTWGDWRVAHPDTTIVARDGGIGREYPFDPLRGRDDNGPIFPVGDVDERLPAQAKVLGVIADDGTPVAFDVAAALQEIEAGRLVTALGITVVADASGVRAIRADGTDAVGHEAFWFAWSQFHAQTELWGATVEPRPAG